MRLGATSEKGREHREHWSCRPHHALELPHALGRMMAFADDPTPDLTATPPPAWRCAVWSGVANLRTDGSLEALVLVPIRARVIGAAPLVVPKGVRARCSAIRCRESGSPLRR
jgi:hypothetical protein